MRNRGSSDMSSLRLPLPVTSVTHGTRVQDVIDESVLLASGIAGTTGSVTLKYAPVASAQGDLVGRFGDSSLVIPSGVLTEEVSFGSLKTLAYTATGSPLTTQETEQSVDYTQFLENGQYYVVYETGRIYYKKATSALDPLVSYKYRSASASSSGAALLSGRQIVDVAGTPEPLAASTPAIKVLVTALDDNSDVVVVGGSEVDATLATRVGTTLAPGDGVSFDITNLDQIYVDAVVSGEGVTYTYTV